MPVVALKELLDRAQAERYGVPAINILNDLTVEAVLAAAAEQGSPVILQTSVKTVKQYGTTQLFAIVTAFAAEAPIPVALHLDHCPERAVISECLAAGWNSVLFDAHDLDVAENLRQTIEVVAEARRYGAHVEGEIEGIQGVEDGIGSDEASHIHGNDVAVDFIRRTGVDCFAPAIGNAHGQYKQAPVLNAQRVTDLVEATGVPMALHGGTGLSDEQFADLIARGCAKVNISTALKESYMKSSLEFLEETAKKDKWDPPSLFRHQRAAAMRTAADHMRLFGSAGAGLVTALVLDCDGVLADTERYGHLPAFNATFEHYGLPVRWSEDDYAEKLTIGGGKERMGSLFADPAFVRAAGVPQEPEARAALLADWHRTKTAEFTRLVQTGALPGRPGIRRIIHAALEAGWTVAVASTSAEASVRAVLEHAVGAEAAASVPVFAGDVVPAKKPDPGIYLLAVERLGIDPAATLVIEDSRNGLLAATAAGLACLVTVNGYTRDEGFDEAVLVVSELGDPGRPPIEVLANRGSAHPGDLITLDDLRDCLRPSGDAATTTDTDRQQEEGPA